MFAVFFLVWPLNGMVFNMRRCDVVIVQRCHEVLRSTKRRKLWQQILTPPAKYFPNPAGNRTENMTTVTTPGYRNRLQRTNTQTSNIIYLYHRTQSALTKEWRYYTTRTLINEGFYIWSHDIIYECIMTIYPFTVYFLNPNTIKLCRQILVKGLWFIMYPIETSMREGRIREGKYSLSDLFI